MPSLTQYILEAGISEDVFILFLSVPIIFVIINIARRIFGLRTFGIYIPLILVVLSSLIGLKNGVILFLVIFLPMVIVRYFLKKISLFSLVDTRVLDTLVFCVIILTTISAFLWIPYIKQITLNPLIFITILAIGLYSESLISIWEIKGFKRFLSPALESLTLITVSYFLINWGFIQKIILKYPLAALLGLVIIIIALAKWRWLKLREYLEFKEVIRHVELPRKK